MSGNHFAIDNLTTVQVEAIVKKLGGEEGAMRFLRGETKIVPIEQKEKLLQAITTIHMVVAKKFVAKDHFKINSSENLQVKIAFCNAIFSNYLLSNVEENVSSDTLGIGKLFKVSSNDDILNELGVSAATTLANMWAMLQIQPSGEEGPLLVNGYANIFYVHDKNGVLWAVSAQWHNEKHGWNIITSWCNDTRDASRYASGNLYDKWDGGCQVIFRSPTGLSFC